MSNEMNTLENKAKFFALYWNQRVLIRNINNPQYDDKIILSAYNYDGWLDKSVVELKSLSSISDEDAIEIAKLYGWDLKKPYVKLTDQIETIRRKLLLFDEGKINIIWNVYLFLISKGYAVRYFNLSTDRLMDHGWIIIKN